MSETPTLDDDSDEALPIEIYGQSSEFPYLHDKNVEAMMSKPISIDQEGFWTFICDDWWEGWIFIPTGDDS